MISIRVTDKWRGEGRPNSILLKFDNWDDYGYKTTYIIRAYDGEAKEVWKSSVQVFCTKMDEKNASKDIRTFMPENIVELDNSFCSLGQDLNYYIKLKELFPNEYREILVRLNDLAYSKSIWDRFKQYEGVHVSLLRSSSSAKALKEAYALLEESFLGQEKLSFSYCAKVPYCISEARFSFIFEKSGSLPGRINALVGKNGTGKTSVLKKLAEDLSGFSRTNVDTSVFEEGARPSFDKVMSVSYSAFDPFMKLKNEKSLRSYVYCGIQREDGSLLDGGEIRKTFISSLKTIKERARFQQWKEIVNELFTDNSYDISLQLEDYVNGSVNWSSGQSVLISSMTEVIAKIDKESILLFDEPELHLHPNAIANVMRMLNRILEEFNSFAIIATHSPIILQEIPSRNISVLERIDNQLFVRKPEIECFGENLSVITRDVFNVTAKESFYQSYFRIQKEEGKKRNEIERLFGNNLGLNALICLDTLFSSGDNS